jgi:hypothetical protein
MYVNLHESTEVQNKMNVSLQIFKELKTQIQNNECFLVCFLVKWVLGQGPERREPKEAVLLLLIIVILISYYYILLLNY